MERLFPHLQNGGHTVPLVLTQWDHVYIEQVMFPVDGE